MGNSCWFSKIVFMFPHVGGKMQIQKNRRLLSSFAISAATALESSPSARVLVALCNGQGGTRADSARRPAEADTWQAVKMFAEAGLQLVSAVSLGRVEDLCPGYFSYGYRGLDKAFHTEGAVLHVFASNPCPYFENVTIGPYFETEIHLDFVGSKLEILREGYCPLAKKLERHCRSFGEVKELDEQTLAQITPPQVLLKFDDLTPLGSNPFKVYLFQLHENAKDCFGQVVHRDGRGIVVDITEWLEGESSDTKGKGLAWGGRERGEKEIYKINSKKESSDISESWKEMWGQMPSFSPARYSHDLSFWTSSDNSCIPSVSVMCLLLWRVGGDFIDSFQVMDDAHIGPDGRRSFTFRIEYKCYAFALGPDTAYRLHREVIGRTLCEAFGFDMR